MIGYGTWYPAVQIIAVLSGYAIATFALLTYIRENIQSMAYFSVALVFLATTFLLPLAPEHWASASTTLGINFILLFSCYALIGYGLVVLRKQ
jgi:hypothetical protein